MAQSNSPALVIHLSSTRKGAVVDASRLFAPAKNERLRYEVKPAPAHDQLKEHIDSFDERTGELRLKALQGAIPGGGLAQVQDGALVTMFELHIYAINQFNMKSSPAVIHVWERYITNPELNPTTPLPEIVVLSEQEPTLTIDLNRHFRDPQNRPLTYTATLLGITVDGVQMPFEELSPAHPLRIFYDSMRNTRIPNRWTLQATQSNRVLVFNVTADNGVKSVSARVAVQEKFIRPPVILQPLPQGFVLTNAVPSFTINLTLYVQDARHNAMYHRPDLSYSVTVWPPEMTTAVSFKGNNMTVKTLSRQQLFTVSVKATNQSQKSVVLTMEVQDTQPVDCQTGKWGAWSSCTVSCGGGTQTRRRHVSQQAENGGANSGGACDVLEETRACNTAPCKVDCIAAIEEEGECNVECGYGWRYVTYKTLLEPANGGNACPLSGYKRCYNFKGCASGQSSLTNAAPP